MIRIAVPGVSVYLPVSPAATSPQTGNVAGMRATSAWRTAKPSIAEFVNGGTLRRATTSRASTSPAELAAAGGAERPGQTAPAGPSMAHSSGGAPSRPVP